MSRFLCLVLCFFSFVAKGYEIRVLEDKTRTYSANQALEIYKKGNTLKLEGMRLNAGLTGSVYWLFVKLDHQERDKHLLIDNPHINRIDLFRSQAGQIDKIITSGDHYPFKQRPVKHPSFVFPLQASANENLYLLRIDKHDESLQFSAGLISEKELYKRAVNENLINGILGGVLAIIIIFGLFLFISVRDKLYLYYVLYILMAALWVITDKGYGYQFLWPESPYFASRARLLANFFFIISMIQFMQAFIDQRKNSPFFRPLKLIQISNLFFCLLTILVPYSFGYANNLLFGFLVLHLLMDVSTVVLIALSISEKIREKNQQALFYLISVVALLAFMMAEIFVQAGMTNGNLYFLRDYGVQTGIVVEAIILNFGLAHRFNRYKNEKEQLLIHANLKQQELTDQIVVIQEHERRKIADQLHDEVGSMLSLISLQISSVIEHGLEENSEDKLLKAGEVLNTVSATIRTMSHTLTPPAIDKYGFKNAITDLVKDLNLSGKLRTEFVLVGFIEPGVYSSLFINDLYRIIKELTGNILLHSEASHCLIQIIEHEEAISILIEDDGNGILCDPEAQNGMGFQNIHSKVDYLKGFFEISGKGEAGTLINIEIPVNPQLT